jgi:zinc transport system substrate-binding protein
LLARQADIITHVLEDIDPGQEEHYHASLEAVHAEIDALDRELTENLLPLKGQSFYAYHGAFGYFAGAYHLHQESIEIGGRSPTPRRVVELIEKARKDGVRVIFVQPQFDQKSARTIAEAIGGTVVPIDPLEKDVFANLRRIGIEIGKALSKDS